MAERSGGNAKPRNAESALRGGLRGGLEPDAQFQSLRGYGRFMLPAPTVAAPVEGAALLLAFTVGCTGAAGAAADARWRASIAAPLTLRLSRCVGD